MRSWRRLSSTSKLLFRPWGRSEYDLIFVIILADILRIVNLETQVKYAQAQAEVGHRGFNRIANIFNVVLPDPSESEIQRLATVIEERLSADKTGREEQEARIEELKAQYVPYPVHRC